MFQIFQDNVLTGFADTRTSWLRLVQFARNDAEASVEVGINNKSELTFTVSSTPIRVRYSCQVLVFQGPSYQEMNHLLINFDQLKHCFLTSLYLGDKRYEWDSRTAYEIE